MPRTDRAVKLRDTLTRAIRWCQEGAALPEKALETLLALDLFRDALGYTRQTAELQPSADRERRQVPDLVLKVNRRDKTSWVVVEFKRPTPTGRVNSPLVLGQVTRYLAAWGARYGIVTNGRTWVFVCAQPKPNATRRFFAEVLLQVSLNSSRPADRRFLEAVLVRCARATLRDLLALLNDLAKLGRDGFNRLQREAGTNHLAPRVAAAIRHQSGRRLNRRDLALLKAACRDPGVPEHCLKDAFTRVGVTVK
jgi:hypothetical protein